MRRRLQQPAIQLGEAPLSASASRFMFAGVQSQPREQALVALDIRIAGREELLAVENRIGTREEAQRLQLIAHLRRGRRTGAPARAA